jgi:oxygen-dependent protoporphyrinogen oxidase
MARVIVVGGGIAGLAAAHELSAIDDAEVVLLEASDRLGGHIRTSPFAGRLAIDESADAFLARVPHATQLAHAVGLGSELTSPAVANAAVWLDGLHSIPDGIVLGVPGKVIRLATSDLLTWRGKARAGLDVVLPRRDHGDSIGALIRQRFGGEIHDRLVDALVGSIYAADTDRFSVEMVPQLAALAGSQRSLLLAARRARRGAPPPADTPLFYAPSAGMAALVDATAAAAAAAGVCIETGSPVAEVAADGGRWRVDGRQADAVVLAAPAPQARRLVSSVAALPDLLARIETAAVALVTLAVPTVSWPDRLRGRSGYLVPKSVQGRVTAVSFASQKWRHWADGVTEILRVSIGRDGAPFDDLDDVALVATAVDEVSSQLELDLQPSAWRVSRWPVAFPQYRPGHQGWLAEVDAACPPGLVLAGASYRGIGIPACIEQGARAALVAAQHVAGARQ